jgi:NAD(P)-dependent dehydrogenase (short-subunit alcohol dehydrogenase family)
MTEKTVLITGCSSGIGRAAAYAFLDDEWRVYATARNPADIEQLGEAGCDISTLDVTKQADVDRVVDRLIEEEGRIDCLVNNAGYGQHGPIEDLSVGDLEAQFDVNLYGVHRLTRAVLPHMRGKGDGTIINVSSVAGQVSAPGMGAYAASKHALEAHSDALRAEVAPLGLDVVIVQPGPVKTSFRERVHDELDEYDRTPDYDFVYDLQEDATLLGGEGPLAVHPKEVADVILEAGVSPDPAARYPVGVVAEAMIYVKFLPDSVQDRLFGLLRKLS